MLQMSIYPGPSTKLLYLRLWICYNNSDSRVLLVKGSIFLEMLHISIWGPITKEWQICNKTTTQVRTRPFSHFWKFYNFCRKFSKLFFQSKNEKLHKCSESSETPRKVVFSQFWKNAYFAYFMHIMHILHF